jgi:hypothetical protein
LQYVKPCLRWPFACGVGTLAMMILHFLLLSPLRYELHLNAIAPPLFFNLDLKHTHHLPVQFEQMRVIWTALLAVAIGHTRERDTNCDVKMFGIKSVGAVDYLRPVLWASLATCLALIFVQAIVFALSLQ